MADCQPRHAFSEVRHVLRELSVLKQKPATAYALQLHLHLRHRRRDIHGTIGTDSVVARLTIKQSNEWIGHFGFSAWGIHERYYGLGEPLKIVGCSNCRLGTFRSGEFTFEVPKYYLRN